MMLLAYSHFIAGNMGGLVLGRLEMAFGGFLTVCLTVALVKSRLHIFLWEALRRSKAPRPATCNPVSGFYIYREITVEIQPSSQ